MRSALKRLIDFLAALLRRIFGHDDGPARLNPVSNLEVVAMAKNVMVSWKNPTTRADGEALNAGDLKAVEIYARQAAIPEFTKVATVTDGSESRGFPNTPSGSWIFRVVAIDSDDGPSDPAEANVTVPKAAISPVSELRVEVQP